jgi:hypothetical protein
MTAIGALILIHLLGAALVAAWPARAALLNLGLCAAAMVPAAMILAAPGGEGWLRADALNAPFVMISAIVALVGWWLRRQDAEALRERAKREKEEERERERREREEAADREAISRRLGALETEARTRAIADARRDEREEHTEKLLTEIRDELREMRHAMLDRGSHPEWRR